MRSPLGIVSKRWSSKTLLSASTDSDPIVRVGRLFDHPASTGGQHTIKPLSGVVVRVPGHGFGVHDVHDVLLVLPLVGTFEHFPECGLLATRGPNCTNVHLLITNFMELQHFGNLRVNVLEFHLFDCLSNVDLQLSILDVLYCNAWEKIDAS